MPDTSVSQTVVVTVLSDESNRVTVVPDETSVVTVATVGVQGPVGPTGPVGIQGPFGPTAISADEGNQALLGSDSLLYVAPQLRRHAWADPYSYCGLAPYGTLDSEEEWAVTRIEMSPSGAVVGTLTASDVAWDDRLTATYS